MMWLTSTVAQFNLDISLGTSPDFSKGWCVSVNHCEVKRIHLALPLGGLPHTLPKKEFLTIFAFVSFKCRKCLGNPNNSNSRFSRMSFLSERLNTFPLLSCTSESFKNSNVTFGHLPAPVLKLSDRPTEYSKRKQSNSSLYYSSGHIKRLTV